MVNLLNNSVFDYWLLNIQVITEWPFHCGRGPALLHPYTPTLLRQVTKGLSFYHPTYICLFIIDNYLI